MGACGGDTLTSVTGCCQRGSFGIFHRGLFQFMPQRFVKARRYQLCLKDCLTVIEARCYGGDGLLTKLS
jgi:hypothetical protein